MRTAAKISAAVAIVASLALSAGAADARDSFKDRDANYLNIGATAIHPVGQVLEWFVVRPYKAITDVYMPEDRRNRRNGDNDCRRLRPARSCGRR